MKLQRDKLNIQKDIEVALNRVKTLETRMFGVELFGLQANEAFLEKISDMNIRPDNQATKLLTVK